MRSDPTEALKSAIEQAESWYAKLMRVHARAARLYGPLAADWPRCPALERLRILCKNMDPAGGLLERAKVSLKPVPASSSASREEWQNLQVSHLRSLAMFCDEARRAESRALAELQSAEHALSERLQKARIGMIAGRDELRGQRSRARQLLEQARMLETGDRSLALPRAAEKALDALQRDQSGYGKGLDQLVDQMPEPPQSEGTRVYGGEAPASGATWVGGNPVTQMKDLDRHLTDLERILKKNRGDIAVVAQWVDGCLERLCGGRNPEATQQIEIIRAELAAVRRTAAVLLDECEARLAETAWREGALRGGIEGQRDVLAELRRMLVETEQQAAGDLGVLGALSGPSGRCVEPRHAELEARIIHFRQGLMAAAGRHLVGLVARPGAGSSGVQDVPPGGDHAGSAGMSGRPVDASARLQHHQRITERLKVLAQELETGEAMLGRQEASPLLESARATIAWADDDFLRNVLLEWRAATGLLEEEITDLHLRPVPARSAAEGRAAAARVVRALEDKLPQIERVTAEVDIAVARMKRVSRDLEPSEHAILESYVASPLAAALVERVLAHVDQRRRDSQRRAVVPFGVRGRVPEPGEPEAEASPVAAIDPVAALLEVERRNREVIVRTIATTEQWADFSRQAWSRILETSRASGDSAGVADAATALVYASRRIEERVLALGELRQGSRVGEAASRLPADGVPLVRAVVRGVGVHGDRR